LPRRKLSTVKPITRDRNTIAGLITPRISAIVTMSPLATSNSADHRLISRFMPLQQTGHGHQRRVLNAPVAKALGALQNPDFRHADLEPCRPVCGRSDNQAYRHFVAR
jgi:hypothetical protein